MGCVQGRGKLVGKVTVGSAPLQTLSPPPTAAKMRATLGEVETCKKKTHCAIPTGPVANSSSVGTKSVVGTSG